MTISVDNYAHKLQLADLLRETVISRAIEALRIDEGASVLDAGCGIGSILPLLARLAGPDGHVTGLDISSEFISKAERGIKAHGLENCVSLVKGDVNSLPFKDGEFDCVISVDCVCYPYSTDPITQIRELKRVTKPGGTVAILGWSYQQLLPGYPRLESELNTSSSLVSPFNEEIDPERHFMRAPDWFQKAGLSNRQSASYAGNICAPLSDQEKEAVLAFFEMLWNDARETVSNEDWSLFERISNPDSSDFILDRDGYYGFFIYTSFTGEVPESDK